jgi:hypothetical protein
VIFVLTGLGAITSIAARAARPRRAMAAGCLLLALGVGITAGAIAADSAAGLFAGTAVAGIGFGLSFLGTFRTLVALAPLTGRAALITAIYIVSYLAFSLPVIAAGIAVTHVGLRGTAVVYACVVAGLSLAAGGMALGPGTATVTRGADPAADTSG